jgi:hypothetical protein
VREGVGEGEGGDAQWRSGRVGVVVGVVVWAGHRGSTTQQPARQVL